MSFGRPLVPEDTKTYASCGRAGVGLRSESPARPRSSVNRPAGAEGASATAVFDTPVRRGVPRNGVSSPLFRSYYLAPLRQTKFVMIFGEREWVGRPYV